MLTYRNSDADGPSYSRLALLRTTAGELHVFAYDRADDSTVVILNNEQARHLATKLAEAFPLGAAPGLIEGDSL